MHCPGRLVVTWSPDVTRSGRARVAMMARLPVPGNVKTRLIPALGAQGACQLYRALARHCAVEVFALASTGEADAEVWHDRGTARQMRAFLGPLPRYRPQPDGDLGARLGQVFMAAASEGRDRCAIVGSDCPGMEARHLRQALALQRDHDLVLGPASDGGYWLIGLRSAALGRALPVLFQGIAWSTDRVLTQTLEAAAKAGLSLALLDELGDVDDLDDLPLWPRFRDPRGHDMRVSVIIPALDEGAVIGEAVSNALHTGADEVIVADGGSRDQTVALAEQAGAVVIEAPRGRASQQNAGAARASGHALVFLHADTRLPGRAALRVRQALDPPDVLFGAFAYTALGAGGWDRVLTVGGRARCALSRHPYGDQAIFVKKRAFKAINGFPDMPIMEDWELVRRLRLLGRAALLSDPAITSSASFAQHGFARTAALNLLAIIGYQLGLEPRRLSIWRGHVIRQRNP